MTGHHRHHGSTSVFAKGEFFATKSQCLSFRFDRRPVGHTRPHHRHLNRPPRRFLQQQRARTHLTPKCLLFDRGL